MKKKPVKNITSRRKINSIDTEIIKLITERRKLSIEIAHSEISRGDSLQEKGRDDELLKKIIKIGNENGLSEEFVKSIFSVIINDSTKFQKKFQENIKTHSKK